MCITWPIVTNPNASIDSCANNGIILQIVSVLKKIPLLHEVHLSVMEKFKKLSIKMHCPAVLHKTKQAKKSMESIPTM